jgi:hypothetical protein
MKLIIVCKDECNSNNSDDFKCGMDSHNSEEIRIVCQQCKGVDIKTIIDMVIEEYTDDYNEGKLGKRNSIEIVYPNCDILKRVIK